MQRRDHGRLAVVDEADVADQRLVEDRVDRRRGRARRAWGGGRSFGRPRGLSASRSHLFWYSCLTVPEQYQISGSSASEIAAQRRGARSRAATLAPGERAAVGPARSRATSTSARPRSPPRSPSCAGAASIVSRPRSGTRVAERPPLRHPIAAVPAGARDLATGNPDPALLPLAAPRSTGPQRLYARRAGARRAGRARRAGVRRRRRPGRTRVPRSTARWTASSACSRPTSRRATPSPSRIPAGPACSTSAGMLGLRLVGVPVDERGMLPDALAGRRRARRRRDAARPQPAAARRSTPRAPRELRARCRTTCWSSRTTTSARSPARRTRRSSRGRARWAAVRSLSKWLGPDLRLAVADRRRDHARARRGPPGARPRLGQRPDPAARRAAVGGRRGLARSPRPPTIYRARREAFAGAASASRRRRSGINVWVPVPDEDAAVRALLAEGWAVAAGTPYRLLRAGRRSASRPRRSTCPRRRRWPRLWSARWRRRCALAPPRDELRRRIERRRGGRCRQCGRPPTGSLRYAPASIPPPQCPGFAAITARSRADHATVGAKPGVAQPPELILDPARQVEPRAQRRDRVGRVLGHDDVADHEAAAGDTPRRGGTGRPCRGRRGGGSPGPRTRGRTGPAGSGSSQPRHAQVGVRQPLARDREHVGAGVDADQRGVRAPREHAQRGLPRARAELEQPLRRPRRARRASSCSRK